MLEREKAALRFAHRIAGMLDLEVKEHSCEGLVIIALPGFLCAIRAALSTDVSARVLLEVPRDLAKQRVLTIEDQIRSDPQQLEEALFHLKQSGVCCRGSGREWSPGMSDGMTQSFLRQREIRKSSMLAVEHYNGFCSGM